jgi:hypothetical protein
MDDLSKRLRDAPGEAVPGRDLWPGIEAGLRAGRPTGNTPPLRRWQKAAAAVVLFGAGAVSGSLLERGRSGDGIAGVESVMRAGSVTRDENIALYRVAELQRAGSAYVAAIARLRDLDTGDDVMRAQGYEVALGVVSVVAQEVTTALGPAVDGQLASSAGRAHAELSARASALLRGAER